MQLGNNHPKLFDAQKYPDKVEGTPSWFNFKVKKRPHGGDKTRFGNKLHHDIASGVGTRVFRNPLCRSLISRFIIESRINHSLPITIITEISKRAGLYRSLSTTNKYVKLNPADYRANPKHHKYYGDIKAKLITKASLIKRWINYILGTNTTYIEGLQKNIEKDIEPP